MSEIQTKDKLITLEELGAAINAKAGVTSVNNQTGAVSITPANIGAVNKAGDTMTGALTIHGDINQQTGIINGDRNSYTDHALQIGHYNLNEMNFYEYSGKFNFYQSYQGNNKLAFQINYHNASSAPLSIKNGGTGATTAVDARFNLGFITGNTVIEFNDGTAVASFGAFGLSARPTVFVATVCSTNAFVITYDWEHSASQIYLHCFFVYNGSLINYSGFVRFSFIIIQ